MPPRSVLSPWIPSPSRRLPPRLLAALELGGAMALVGSAVPLAKHLVTLWPVHLLAELRLALAGVVLFALARRAGVAPWPARGPDWTLLAGQALAGMFAFNLLLLHGLRLTGAAEGGIVTGATPAFAAALAVWLLGERLTRAAGFGVLAAACGVAALSAGGAGAGASASGPRPVFGTLLVAGAALGEALYVVLGRRAAGRLAPLTVATTLALLGAMMFLPLALLDLAREGWPAPGLGGWFGLGYYALAATVAPLVLWARGIARLPAHTAGAFTAVMPLAAVALSYALLGEPFRWAHAAGGALVLTGLLLAARGRAGDAPESWMKTGPKAPGGGGGESPRG